MIKGYRIIEGNLMAEKCTSDFGGPNMWYLCVKTTTNSWEEVQWMNVHKIQLLFKEKLPVYKEENPIKKYELI